MASAPRPKAAKAARKSPAAKAPGPAAAKTPARPAKAPAAKAGARSTVLKLVPKRAASAGAAAKPANGIQRFTLHTGATLSARAQKALSAKRAALARAAAAKAATMDPESVAYGYLQTALKSDDVPGLADPQTAAGGSEFVRLGTETVPLTNTRVVKYRQAVNKIPVYGSLVSVELDENNKLLAINSSLGAPADVSAVASIAPRQALEAVHGASRTKLAEIKSTPRLFYYFDQPTGRWLLAYIVENVRASAPASSSSARTGHPRPAFHDYVVNAHTGKLVATLPRTNSAAIIEQAVDGLGVSRRFTVETNSANRTMRNRALKLSTHTFRFRDPQREFARLPGDVVKRNPQASSRANWPRAAVSAHANAEIVARFLRDVLKRDGIDNQGSEMVSTVDCVVASESGGGQEWVNAYWDPDARQMVYGQRLRSPRQPLSMAALLDIVAHEMFHGVTDSTARLEYAGQSGALNESYSDILGVIIGNASRRRRDLWVWQVGMDFEADGEPLRDLETPGRCNQPAHMDDFLVTGRPSEANDWGGVHSNSGIHNHAAFRIMIASHEGKPVFTANELAALFYLALTQHLTRTSDFSDSRRALLLVARTLFRNESAAALKVRTRAIEKAFTAVGIR